MKRLFALRAATCAKNSAESIAESVVAMCSELFTRNNLSGDDIVSLQFSLTSDLDEINPCAALRKNYSGSVDVSRIPLFCTQEAVVKNALPRVIRLIAHVYMEESAAPVHVYTRGAEALRPEFALESESRSLSNSRLEKKNIPLKKMKLWTVTMECAGLAEAGGVKSVAYSVSDEAARQGYDVTLFIPVYACSEFDCVTDVKDSVLSADIAVCNKKERVDFSTGRFKNTPVKIVFIRHPSFAEKCAVYVYTEEEERKNPEHVRGTGHHDTLFLDALLSKAVVAYARLLSDSEKPDIIHCHDASVAVLPSYLAAAMPDSGIACAVTVHNAGPAYHHEFRDLAEAAYYTGLPEEKLRSALNRGRVEPFLLAGKDAHLTTVSTFYAEELTNAAFSNETDGLSPLFSAERISVTGITNGIEIERYNPENTASSLLPYSFSPERTSLSGKYENRRFLLELASLKETQRDDGRFQPFFDGIKPFGSLLHEGEDEPNAVYFTYQGRIVRQKGIDILIPAVKDLLQRGENVRFIAAGQGEPALENELLSLARDFSGKVVYFKGYNKKTARLAVAAADFLLMPSVFEPCGLEDLIAQLFGTLPIAHATGGLKKIQNGKTGFLYAPNTAETLCNAIMTAAIFKRVHEAELREMIAYAARTVKNTYSWTSVVKDGYIPFFKKLV